MKIYALGGPCGAGKTFYRTHDPKLKDLPFFDIRDVYRENPGIGYREAFGLFAEKVEEAIGSTEELMLEAHFKPGGFQDIWLRRIEALYGLEIQRMYFDLDPLEATRRILNAYDKDGDRVYAEARLRMTWS